MKAIFTNYRYYVLAVMVMAVIVLIFCDVGWIISKLVKRWERMGAVPELSNAKKNY